MSTQTTVCPYCSEEIKATAVKCRFCGEFLREPQGQDEPVAPVAPRRPGTGRLAVPQAGSKPVQPAKAVPTTRQKANALLAATLPVGLIGLSVGSSAPGFWPCFIFLGAPVLAILFDSANTYRTPSWVLAALAPFFWLSAVVYGFKRLKRPSDLPPGVGWRKVPGTFPVVALATWAALFSVAAGLPPKPGSAPGQASQATADQAPAPAQEKPTAAVAPHEEPTWNSQDLDIKTNGNIDTAVAMMASMDAGALKSQAAHPAAATVMKTPWKFYGKVLSFDGVAEIVQDYPPNSDVAQRFGGPAAEIVFDAADGTIVDYFLIGETGSIQKGGHVKVFGAPVGQVVVDNMIGGKTTQLVLVGKLATP